MSTEFSSRVTDPGKNGFSGVGRLGGRITIDLGGDYKWREADDSFLKSLGIKEKKEWKL